MASQPQKHAPPQETAKKLDPKAPSTPAAKAEAAPAKERAPRIVRNRYNLVDASGKKISFSHYQLPTRRAETGKVKIDGTETAFIVTKSQSRDKKEDRAYSYFKLPNGSTGYVKGELANGAEYKVEELPPAEPFGGKKHTLNAQPAQPK